MTRPLALLAVVSLAACGGGSVRLSVTSDDAAGAQALALQGPSVDLTTVRSVTVTLREVWAHVDPVGEGAAPATDGAADDDARWHRVWVGPRTLDLMTVRQGQLALLGEVALPVGQVTQVRLVLAAEPGQAEARVAGAVEDSDGARCDLLLPLSAWSPGVKAQGPLSPWSAVPGVTPGAVLNLQLKDSARVTDAAPCAFRLNPVLRLAQER